MEEHFCQLTKHSAGNMEDCSRVAKSIAALVECFRWEARKCMAVGALCRKNGLSIFGLGEAERCQLELWQLCAGASRGASLWPEYLGLGEALRGQLWL